VITTLPTPGKALGTASSAWCYREIGLDRIILDFHSARGSKKRICNLTPALSLVVRKREDYSGVAFSLGGEEKGRIVFLWFILLEKVDLINNKNPSPHTTAADGKLSL
jgi:hypothetical protein